MMTRLSKFLFLQTFDTCWKFPSKDNFLREEVGLLHVFGNFEVKKTFVFLLSHQTHFEALETKTPSFVL